MKKKKRMNSITIICYSDGNIRRFEINTYLLVLNNLKAWKNGNKLLIKISIICLYVWKNILKITFLLYQKIKKN